MYVNCLLSKSDAECPLSVVSVDIRCLLPESEVNCLSMISDVKILLSKSEVCCLLFETSVEF